jgi:carboxyl-terminal processing protease
LRASSNGKPEALKGLVLDLRNDPGGLLKEAVEICELFLNDGQAIVSTRGRTPEQNAVYYSHNKTPLTDVPMVVLINAGSASASEIVAGALKDTKRAVLVGTRSFGKGSVQTIRELSDGSGLSLTTARYFTPAGTMIHGVGVAPDIEVKLKIQGREDDGQEPMREKELMENFQGLKDSRPEAPAKLKTPSDKEAPKVIPPPKPEFGPRKVFDLEKDNQLQRAVEVIKEWAILNTVTLGKKPS